MKIGCTSWSFRNSLEKGKLDSIQWIKKCALELKLDGIEFLDKFVPRTDENYLKEIKKLCADLYLDIFLVSACPVLGKEDIEEHKAQINYLKQWIDIGFYMGAPIVRYLAGPKEGEKSWDLMIEATKECVGYAQKKGIILAIENHSGMGETCEEILRIFEAINSPWLKLCLDTGNFKDKDIYSSIEKTLHLTGVVHVKTYSPDTEGKEQRLDYERIFKIFKKADYRGYLSIEYIGKEDESTAIPRSIRYLRKKIAELNNIL